LARRILVAYQGLGLVKVAEGGRVRYNAPLFASVTSVADTATADWWPRARWGRLTDGRRHTGRPGAVASLARDWDDTFVP